VQPRTGSTLALFTLLAVPFLQFPIGTLADETKVETFIGTWEGVQIGRAGNPVEAVYTFRAHNGGLAGEGESRVSGLPNYGARWSVGEPRICANGQGRGLIK